MNQKDDIPMATRSRRCLLRSKSNKKPRKVISSESGAKIPAPTSDTSVTTMGAV